MDIKTFLVKELNRREDLAKPFKEKISIEEFEKDDEPEEVTVSKEVVVDYLLKSGYDLTPDNYERAEQMLRSMEGTKLKSTLKNAGKMDEQRYKTIDHLNDLTVEELNSLLNIAVLNALNNISNQLNNINNSATKYTYSIERIHDSRGATNVRHMTEVINRYAANGYRVVSIFTNELGKNVTSVGGFGVNSTVDEVIIVFEKPL
ncbi:MAG: hypothetical protein IKO27_08530 [Ruminococcus sp.]|nr:hypothetical protein [Ruminococcus sp.]